MAFKLILILLLSSSLTIPDGVTVVNDFEATRYLGTWYEVARLEQPYEKGLVDISARYSQRDDGGINVVNQGRNLKTGQWQQIQGKAYLVSEARMGQLKVSFFGPFYAAYNIIALDKQNYSYAMVAGANKENLWILSRTASLSPELLKNLLEQAKQLGFKTDNMIFS
ncbi:MAG: lipocalin family protein [Methylococcaceae bacterium]|jgi:apolipoprotein D and lipocalin family protein